MEAEVAALLKAAGAQNEQKLEEEALALQVDLQLCVMQVA